MSSPRILVIRGGAIGDFIMTLPAIGALRERWPEAQLEILGYPHIIELARQRHYANATRSIEARALAGFFVPRAMLDPDLVAYFKSFQLVVSYIFDPDRVFAENLLRCGVKQLVEGSPRPSDRPAAEHYCQPLERLAIYPVATEPRLYPHAADRAFAQTYLAGHDARRLVAVHVGSGSPKKNWPAARFAAVAGWLQAERGAELLAVSGEADAVALAQFRQALGPRPHREASGLTLPQLAAVLEACAAFVGNDSGVTHVAAAVRTPTVALFGPASTAIWEPRGARVHVIPFGPAAEQAARAALAGWLERAAC